MQANCIQVGGTPTMFDQVWPMPDNVVQAWSIPVLSTTTFKQLLFTTQPDLWIRFATNAQRLLRLGRRFAASKNQPVWHLRCLARARQPVGLQGPWDDRGWELGGA